MAGNTSAPGAPVVSRAVALLTAFDETHSRLTLTELARRAGLPLATAHRLTGELAGHGVLARTLSGEYRPGFPPHRRRHARPVPAESFIQTQ